MSGMSRTALLTSAKRHDARMGVEYEFMRLTIPRELSRSAVTRMLVDRA